MSAKTAGSLPHHPMYLVLLSDGSGIVLETRGFWVLEVSWRNGLKSTVVKGKLNKAFL